MREMMIVLLGLVVVFVGCSKPERQLVVVETVSETEKAPEVEVKQLREPINETDFIQAVGKDLKKDNGQGDVVYLRGVNAGGYLFQEFWMTPTSASDGIKAELDLYNYLDEKYGVDERKEIIGIYQDAYWGVEDFERCAQMGMNVIRLPFWYRNIVEADSTVIADWHQRFDWFIEQAGKHGMYVILDFHGAPGSQNGSDHSGVDGGENKEAASEFFFGDEENVSQNQELFYKIWELIASRYLDNPVVAGYDLLNEPFCTYRYNSSYSESELHQIYWKVYDEAYKRIREIDPKHVIIMEATWDPKDLPDPKLYGWENVMYQYHNYLYDDYNNEAGKQIQNMKKKINLIKAAHYDVPSYMGEFNYFNSYEAWDEGLALLNESDLHWTIWTYKTVIQYKNWGLYNQSVGELNIETATLERIKTFYGTVDKVMPNKKLIEISSKHFRESF